MATAGESPSTLDSLGTIPCPLCDGKVSFCEDEDGDAVILHTMPLCAWFETGTIDDYRAALDAHPDIKRAVMAGRKTT